MTSQTNTFSLKFSKALQSFINNPDQHPDGSEKRVCSMYIYKKKGVIYVRNATNKIAMIITAQEDGGHDFQLQFINATVFRRLMAVKETLGWDDINLEPKVGFVYLYTKSGKRLTLSNHKVYHKNELEELTNDLVG